MLYYENSDNNYKKIFFNKVDKNLYNCILTQYQKRKLIYFET